MARSDLQGFFRQLFPRRAPSSGKAAADSGSLTDEVTSSCSTVVRSQSPAHRDLDPAGAPPTGPPWSVPDGTGLSSAEHKSLLVHLRDTGDPNEQLCAEYKLQILRHTERFCSLMERARNARRQRKAQVDKEFRATRSAFYTAGRLRDEEALRLREALERNDQRARESLRDRVLQQCDRHNLLAQRGVEACMRFAETVLSGEIEIGRNVLARVRSQVPVPQHRDGVVNSEMSETAHMRLGLRVPEAVTSRGDTLFPIPEGWSIFNVGHTAHGNAEVREHVPIPSPPLLEDDPPPCGESPGGSSAQNMHLFNAGLLESFEDHFSDVEKERERQWRCLQEQLDADLSLWWDGYRALIASLACQFNSEDSPGRFGNAFKAADEYDRSSARATFSLAEFWRVHDMEQLWEQTKAVFALHHGAFVERLRAAERGLESDDYRPQTLVPIAPRGAAIWIPSQRHDITSHRYSCGAGSSEFVPPFSLRNLLTVPIVSRALPTASPRLQMVRATRPTPRLRTLDKPTFSRLLQCRTGHAFTGEYFRAINKPERGYACTCGVPLQTRDHILVGCPDLEAFRAPLYACSPQLIVADLLGTHEGLLATAKFLKSSGALMKPADEEAAAADD